MSVEQLPSPPLSKHARIIYGSLVGAIVLFSAYQGDWVWALMALMSFFIGFWELYAMMLVRNIQPSRLISFGIGVLFYPLAYWGLERHFQLLITLGVLLTFTWMLFRKSRPSIADIGGTIVMFFYLGFLPSHAILLRNLGPGELGLKYLLLLIFAVSFSDIGAYYGGKAFGKNLLSPQISPKKTIEGLLWGSLTGLGVSLIAASIMNLPLPHAAFFGIVLPMVGVLGDLFESLLKRDAGVKDSGTLIPGHGGVLDRTDSYIFAVVVAYYYVYWGVLQHGLAGEVLQIIKDLHF